MKHDFKFVSKHSPQVREAYDNLQELLGEVHRDLRRHYTFEHRPVGSYSRNMMTCDSRSNVGFDFDINIYPNDDDNEFSAKQIKSLFKASLDRFSQRCGFDDGKEHQEYIRFNKKQNSYEWTERSPAFYARSERYEQLVDEGLKEELKEVYLQKKNHNDDENKRSCSLFAEAINECYMRYIAE